MAKVHKRVVPAIVCNPSIGGGGRLFAAKTESTFVSNVSSFPGNPKGVLGARISRIRAESISVITSHITFRFVI